MYKTSLLNIQAVDHAMLTPVERKRLRDAGRDAYYREYGVQRDSSLERQAKQAKGDNAGRRALDDWKRNRCYQKFQELSRQEQVRLLPAYEAYHRDEDARLAADMEATRTEAAAQAAVCTQTPRASRLTAPCLFEVQRAGLSGEHLKQNTRSTRSCASIS